jgi:hypothetical protein
VLQERLLSGRVLYFGTNKMYLECFTNVRFDNYHYPTNWQFTYVDMVVKSSIDRLGSRTECFKYWATLVATYSELHLTDITDRLPALSGLASDFRSVTDAHYLAGVWCEDMPRALTWYVPPWEKATAVSSSPPSYIAPSWSWAAAEFGVQFVSPGYNSQFHHGVDIIATGVTPASLDPFGTVKGGFIDLSGRMRVGLVKELPDLLVPRRRTLYLQAGNSDSPPLAIYAPDNANKVESREFRVLLLYLGSFSGKEAAAMAIKAVDDEIGIYERLGLAFSEHSGGGWACKRFEEFFQHAPNTRLRLI